MWNDLIGRLYDGAQFATPASDEEIDQIQRRLGQEVPVELRDFLRGTNGVQDEYGSGLVWSVQQIIEENEAFRRSADFARLYMSFDQLMFVGDNGGGDQFAYVRVPVARDDVFVWDHETDDRKRVAGSLKDYLERRAGSDGDEWYR
ncbi:SMI1/KNR4 family protein [Nonomuraea longispora]|uniref:SMI1/KNR4 family protein n=1 Tax=Nonomuraea longispora TaxID=1848320 RepID=A0A4V2XLQ8_9ACTN|nr:SMI1/KNR4 family protein [Nonomuraea longispora]TDC11386.1 SMI1/KNR4 family protein [Nonomuraea longispora]